MVQQSMQLAKNGKVEGIPFAVRQNFSTIEQTWGTATNQASAGAGTYATYSAHAAAFGFNQGEQVFDIRSYSKTLRAITLANIESVLGPPTVVRQSSDSFIYLYPAGPDYQLLWVFPKTRADQPGPTVNHISVFWPQGTVNLMAQNQPNPSVVVDNAPGTVGSLFTFSIQQAPIGYQLVELEWLPRSAIPVVDTVSQAMTNGQTGAYNPGFSISGDGQTTSFIYPSSMVNQTGFVRVIYQNAAGTAIIGTSATIPLK